MLVVTFIVPGEPIAKGRPRLSTFGGRARAYTPAKTVRYEQLVALAAQQAMGEMPPMAGVAVSVNLEARVSVPASWSKRKRAAALEGEIKPTSRPDIDNFAKAATDGMNGIVYVDDAQIVRLDAQKHYAETPGLLVYVTMA